MNSECRVTELISSIENVFQEEGLDKHSDVATEIAHILDDYERTGIVMSEWHPSLAFWDSDAR